MHERRDETDEMKQRILRLSKRVLNALLFTGERQREYTELRGPEATQVFTDRGMDKEVVHTSI